MLKVFTVYNDLKVKEMPVIYTSEKAETKELKAAIGQLLRMGQIEEADQLYHEFVALRPDVRLPASDIRRELPVIEMILYIIKMEKEYGVEGMYEDSQELSELIDNFRKIKEVIISGKCEEVSKELHISEIARQVILQNLDF
jgi:hypothetical protein